MGVLSEIRTLPAVLRELTAAVRDVAELTRENAPAMERLEGLERSRATWEAEVEGAFLKADSRYKAAAASEARSRSLEKNAKAIADPFSEEGNEISDGIPAEYVGIGNGEPLPPVHQDLGVLSPKQLALRMKYS